MRSFYLPEVEFCPGAVVALPADLHRHLIRVLRLQVGAEILLFNGDGQVARSLLKADSSVEFLRIDNYPPPSCPLTLIQGIPKGDKAELILQKGTEVGVNEFRMVPMARSVSQLKADRKQKRVQRWEKIIHEAARQCEQYYLPKLQVESSFAEVLNTVDADLKLLLWEESTEPLPSVLPQVSPKNVAVVVGPEGGITPQEADQANRAGFRLVSIGPRILRTETAGLAIMTILQYLYGDLAAGRQA